MKPLSDKVALITGAGRGIGSAIARALADQGADVILAARTPSELAATAAEIQKKGRKVLTVRTDVSLEHDVETVTSAAINTFGRIDILVNNAGLGYFAEITNLGVHEFDEMWNVNMRGVFLCCKAVIPHMIKQESGDVVNIASLAGRNAFKGGAGYSATKWALIGFSRTLMLEVRQHNIRVITLCPGSVDTSFGSHAKSAPRSSGTIPSAADIARITTETLLLPRHVMVSEIDIRPTNPHK